MPASNDNHDNVDFEQKTIRYICMEFAELFEGEGESDVERAQNALNRAKQIMCNLEPLVTQLGRQMPKYVINALPPGLVNQEEK